MEDEEFLGLMNKRENLIKEKEFAQAATVDVEIQDKIRKKEQDTFDELKEKTQELVDEAIVKYNSNVEMIVSSFKDIEFAVRERADISFQNAQSTHIRELINIEKEFAVERLRSEKRTVKDEEILKKKGNTLLKNGEKEAAGCVFIEADKAREAELKRRASEINKTYENQRKAIIEKQKNELRILDEKLVNNLQQVDAARVSQLEAQVTQLRVSIISILNKVTEGISLHVFTRKQKADFSKKLGSFVQSYVADLVDLNLMSSEPQKNLTTNEKTSLL